MQALTFFFAFVAVLALIGVVAWLIRQFASNRLGANTQRGRMPRLAVIDAAAVDGRRRLVLVRRDNVEHLLMIGGPTDIVVEPNIVRAMPGRDQLPPRPAVASANADVQPRIAPLPDHPTGWGDAEAVRPDPFDHAEPPMPEPPPRPARPAFADEARRPPRPERGADPLAGFAPEPMGSRSEVRPEPPPAPAHAPNRTHDAASRAAGRSGAEAAGSRSASRGPAADATADANIGTCDVLGGSEILPRWRNGSRQHFDAPEVMRSRHRLRRNRRLPAQRLIAASRRRHPRHRARRVASTISKTRWPRCSAARRILREGRRPSA